MFTVHYAIKIKLSLSKINLQREQFLNRNETKNFADFSFGEARERKKRKKYKFSSEMGAR